MYTKPFNYIGGLIPLHFYRNVKVSLLQMYSFTHYLAFHKP